MTNQQHEDEPETTEKATNQSLVFIWTIVAVVAFASVITIFAALAINHSSDDQPDGPFAIAAAVITPSAESPTPTVGAVIAGATESAATATATAPPPPIASSATQSPVIGDAISATPNAPAPSTSTLDPVADALRTSIESQYGVRILTSGQDWGADKGLQLRNIGAIGSALSSLPTGVRVATNSSLPLTFLSNHSGMTEAGWEPYGAREANFYSNEDVSTSGRAAANQVVLQPGSNSQTITHEIMHAYQMLGIAPGQYALALLTPDMKSFMQATGWTQLGSDDDVRAAAGSGWDALNAMFQYNGRPLTYQNEFGDSLSLFIPNPIEAYAEAGGLYYGHSSALTLPEWPEYWDWFSAHLG